MNRRIGVCLVGSALTMFLIGLGWASIAAPASNQAVTLVGAAAPQSGGGSGTPLPAAFLATPSATPTCVPFSWTAASAVPYAIARYAFAQTGNTFYVLGGVTTGGVITNTVSRYDAGTDLWTTLAPIPGPIPGEAPAAALYGGKIYLAGGTNDPTGFRIYTIASNTWSIPSPGPMGTYGAAAGAFNGRIFFAGGTSLAGPTTPLQIYDPVANNWSSGSVLPGSGYFRGGYQQAGAYLYLAGSFGAAPQTLTGSRSAAWDLRLSNWEAPASNGQATLRLDMTVAPGVWSIGPTFTPARADFGLAYAAGKLYALGGDANGGTYNDATDLVDELDVSTWPTGSWVASPPYLPGVRQSNSAGFTDLSNRIYSTGYYAGTFSPAHIRRPVGNTACLTPTPPPTKTVTPTATGTPATPLPSPTICYSYGINTGSAVIVPGTNRIDGAGCDDCAVDVTLPFTFPLYDGPLLAQGQQPQGPPIMRVSANGKIGYYCCGNPNQPQQPDINLCLPAPDEVYTIFPHWDDLVTTCACCGIFTSTTGLTPNQVFNVEWRAEYYAGGGNAHFEVRLYEGNPVHFDLIYERVDQGGSGATVGIQRDPTTATQYSCNVPGSLTTGLLLQFARVLCSAVTPTPPATGKGPLVSPTVVWTPAPFCPVPTATPCAIQFADVPVGSTFYEFIRCLACRGIVSGYPCGGVGEPCPGTYFRPNNNVTRGQVTKIVSESANFSNVVPSTQWTFQDVSPSGTFWLWVERIAGRGIINGYPCGGVGEPCVAPGNRPYFRPNYNVTRSQVSKIDANAAGYNETPTTQTFEDVPPGSTFWLWVERIASRGIIGGYPCGTNPSEPCVAPGNRPYFRPGNSLTRGQTARILASTFYPGCSTPARR